LGVQIPGLVLPQTVKNLDKALGKLILALGENWATKLKQWTAVGQGKILKIKAKDKIAVEELFQNAEDRRKFKNRTQATISAIEDIAANAADADPSAEIGDDWLNLFARIAEDKSSEELQHLFGKILSGEIRRPGSYSLRTLQILATISKEDAELVSRLLSYALDKKIIPFGQGIGPSDLERLLLEELGLAGHPSHIGGMALTFTVQAQDKLVVLATHLSILIVNKTSYQLQASLPGQALTTSAAELYRIANPPPTDFEFMRAIAKMVFGDLRGRYQADVDNGLILVHVAHVVPVPEKKDYFNVQVMFTVTKDAP
jgi:hypothetical protein